MFKDLMSDPDEGSHKVGQFYNVKEVGHFNFCII